ncbi:SDR family NAD(P)-dependent oxidoreductase [Microvirga sp. BT688]|uniref:type I polyketide synthase n=1 Tax=Microvirga sp. TaxID=1873136 RepID=UPI00168776C9|nr:type I polyketide synthase [Microvirga sp.]MBD2750179.1 SDR family NAD(P)-dependent oxidoreductase [Microvirga sp.]
MAGIDSDIAIVGIGLRVPGASDPATFWDNLREGRESVRQLTEDELLKAGVPREIFLRPNYVRAAATLDRMEVFDAEFFGFSPKEAAIMDPQHRQFLEVCWEAFEDAGHSPEAFAGSIGMFAGCGMGSYFAFNLLSNPDLVRNVGTFLLRHTGNDKDFLTTRASYLFNLRGPSVNVQTACSTSLVATHLACQHLLSGECDMALAGGVTIEIPHGRGYHYEPGEILSPDGHCRAFDHRSEGTVFGSGAAVVVLRRLQDAVADGDRIYAVIKATAVNNDGSSKVGYLAPSVEGQAACISEALAVADVGPESIRYVECHGTGTRMGDPIEVAALTQAFGGGKGGVGYCGIGSVKTNIGHLDTAAGVVSLAKTALALYHREIPPSINFERSNPLIDFATSPFYVQDKLQPWGSSGEPRRAGVNSLGVGGTNAFAVLEEHVQIPARAAKPRQRLLTLSTRSRPALDEGCARLANYLREHPELDLGDVAWTLQKGRRAFSERRVLAARDRDEAIRLLEQNDSRRVFTHTASGGNQSIVFMFPGGGSQYPRMAADLYSVEPVFAKHMDVGLDLLKSRHGIDLRPPLLCEPHKSAEAGKALEDPSLQLPAIFIVEYALAQLVMSWGVKPQALLGHSLGENTAACVAGTMTFEDCLGLVVLRGRLMDRVSGAMVSVPVPAGELQPHLDALGLDLAAVNAPDLCVASGAASGIAALEERLAEIGVEAQRIKINIAAHSRLLEPVLSEFETYLRSIRLAAPSIRWVSNRTGTWITDAEATDPAYWVQHLRGSVRFADCIETLAQDPGRLFLEVGPGKVLSSLTKAHPAVKAGQAIIPTLRHPEEQVSDETFLLTALGRLWASGGVLNSDRLFEGEQRRRVGLPTYAFQGQRYFFEPGAAREQSRKSEALFVDKEPDESRWYWAPVWKMREADDAVEDPISWLVFMDDRGIGDALIERMRRHGDQVVIVRAGDSYQRISDDEYVIAPEHGRLGYDALVRDLVRTGRAPDRVAHLALLSRPESFRPGSSLFHRNQEQGFYSLLFFAQAWAVEGSKRPLHMVVATSGMQKVRDRDEVSQPEQATVLGPVKVIPREFVDVTVSCVDLDTGNVIPRSRGLRGVLAATRRKHDTHADKGEISSALDLLEAELRAPSGNGIVAHRGSNRYVQDLRRKAIPEGGEIPLRQRGTVIITGGFGGIGLTVAKELATSRDARIVLISRTKLPERLQWQETTCKLGPDHHLSRTIAQIEQIEALGAEVLILQADVTNIESMRSAVQVVRQRYGSINGLVHAAGVIRDDLLATKSQSDIEEVLAPKVYGTLVLDEVLKDDDLDMFVVFSSTSTVTAPVGQVDYVAANAFLNAFAEARSRQKRGKTIAIDWGVWSEVGMAARSAAKMLRNSPDADAKPASHPFFDRVTTDGKGVTTLEARWTAADRWYLAEHRTAQGDALLPGSGYPELAAAALREIGLSRPFEIQDLLFFRPLAVDEGGKDIRVKLTPTVEGYSFEVAIRVNLDPTLSAGAASLTGWRRVGQAELILHEQSPIAPIDLAAIERESTRRLPVITKQQNHLRFGPRWSVVERVAASEGRAIAHLKLADRFADDLEDFGLHPAMMDLATGFAMDLITGYTGNSLWVPVSYHSIRVLGALPSEICSVISVREGSTEAAGFAQFDVTITDQLGNVFVNVERFTIKRLDAALDISHEPLTEAGDVDLDHDPSLERALSQSELTFQQNLSQGIAAEEGRRAFVRAIAGYQGAQVYVSSMDLAALVGQADASSSLSQPSSAASPGASFARPELDANYVEPRDEIEATLAELWCELLGVSRVGALDNFFNLGGHSLIAVRLFAKVKRVFSIEFPISVLFEAPTIEACANLIRATMPKDDERDDGGATTVSNQPRYRHLVAMHSGEGRSRRPFFLVAGMFGNVLNLRHLAHQIGADRPFYGLQARGVYGDDEPHETFEEMAQDYLKEIRLVQPRGPYSLGGFSGGGIAALEIARQLKQEGEEVDLLVMLDTPLPRSEQLTRKDKIVMHMQSLRRSGPRHLVEAVKGRAAWQRHLAQEKNGPGVLEQGALHSAAIGAAFHRALARYELKPYDGAITLFRPKLKPAHVFGPGRQIDVQRRFIYEDNGWDRFCRAVIVSEVPGDHDSMVLEPNVRVLAAKMQTVIDHAERASSGSWFGPKNGDPIRSTILEPIVIPQLPCRHSVEGQDTGDIQLLSLQAGKAAADNRRIESEQQV